MKEIDMVKDEMKFTIQKESQKKISLIETYYQDQITHLH